MDRDDSLDSNNFKDQTTDPCESSRNNNYTIDLNIISVQRLYNLKKLFSGNIGSYILAIFSTRKKIELVNELNGKKNDFKKVSIKNVIPTQNYYYYYYN